MRGSIAWLLAGWGALLVCGLAAMAVRDNRAGARGTVPETWPSESTLARDPRRLTLLLFAHPHCPCTVATLRELERIVSRSTGRLRTEVLFCVPDGAPADWERSGLWEQACAIPGVEVLADRAGCEARLFGARTSGTALLYDSQGALCFEGGITGARGHEGDNAGKSAVLACVQACLGRSASVPVFGCPLFDSGSSGSAGDGEAGQKP
jgi:hypothetical protein